MFRTRGTLCQRTLRSLLTSIPPTDVSWGYAYPMPTKRSITAYETSETAGVWMRFRDICRKLGIPRSAALAQAAQLWLDAKSAEGTYVPGFVRIEDARD